MAQWHYRYAGLSIASEVPIPEWTVFEQYGPARDVDIHIRLDGRRVKNVTETSEACAASGDYRFFIPEVGEYHVRRGCEIVVSPAPTASENEIRLFLIGSAWGALCYQRGILALHASVVQVDSGAIAFCGETGAGKSTLAARLMACGYPLIGDDLCCFDIAEGMPRVHPSAPRLKLWREALSALAWSSTGLFRDHFRTEKFIVDLTHKRTLKLAPLRAVCILEWGDINLTRIKGMSGLRRLVASSAYRPSVLESLGKTGDYWEQCAKLARVTPVWELKRPRDWMVLDEVVERIMKQWPPVAS
jgi:hypothetical protein